MLNPPPEGTPEFKQWLDSLMLHSQQYLKELTTPIYIPSTYENTGKSIGVAGDCRTYKSPFNRQSFGIPSNARHE